MTLRIVNDAVGHYQLRRDADRGRRGDEAVLECAGIADVLSKSQGSANPINVVHATVAALKGLSRPEEIAAKRGLPIEDVAPKAMLAARAAATGAGAA